VRDCPKLRTTPFGFTLIELLTVMVIILLLAGIVLGIAGFMLKKGGTDRTAAELATIEMALEEFKSDYGAYPCTSNDVVTVLTNRNATVWIGNGSVSVSPTRAYFPEFKGLDPFGVPYNYRGPTANRVNKGTFDLWSNGPDRANSSTNSASNPTESTEDDITNWK
jgi:general secretion pathway protein G